MTMLYAKFTLSLSIKGGRNRRVNGGALFISGPEPICNLHLT